MLRPNIPALIFKMNGYDKYGQPLYLTSAKCKCGIVTFLNSALRTTVRADSSASHGRATEFVFDAVLLFPKNTKIEENDKVEILGETLRVKSVHKRFNIVGVLDHLEVGLNVWE